MRLSSRIRVIYVKELVDILRDRRTLIAMVVVPVLLYPLLMLGSVQAISAQEATLRERTVVIVGTPDEGQRSFFQHLIDEDKMALEQEGAAAGDGAEEDQERPQPFRAKVLAVGPDLQALVQAREIHIGVEFPNYSTRDPDVGQLQVRRVFDPEEIRSEMAARWLSEMLERYAQRERERRCRLFNMPPEAVDPVVVESSRMATAGSILSQILPLILVLMTITGAIYPAIDLTAGERERGTLETLMVCPVPVIDLIVGKFLVITTIAILGAVLNLASISATVYFGGFQSALSGSDEASFPFAVFPIILLALVPFAILFSAVMIAVCSCARTFKEAQNYITPIILAALVPGGIAALPASKLEGTMLVVPVANMVLLTKELLLGATGGKIIGGNVSWSALAWVLASTTLYAAAAVAAAARIFGTESVVFADAGSMRSALARRLTRPSLRPSLAMVAVLTALLFPAWFYLQSSLQMAAEGDLVSILRSTAIWMPVLFIGLPLAVLLYWKVDLTTTFRLRGCHWRFYLAAVLIGLTAWAPLHELFLLQSRFLPIPEALVEGEDRFVTAFESVAPWLAILLIAVIPGLSEECFFRGFLMSGLANSTRKWTAIIASAVVFGVFHFYLFKLPVTVALGAVLGYLCWQAASVWPAVLAHVVHNGFVVVRTHLLDLDRLLGIETGDSLEHLPAMVIGAALGLMLVALAMCRTARRREAPPWDAQASGAALPLTK